MKKLLLLLLFIPIMSFGQITYNDLMSIKSVDTFKKVVIENGLVALCRDPFSCISIPQFGRFFPIITSPI